MKKGFNELFDDLAVKIAAAASEESVPLPDKVDALKALTVYDAQRFKQLKGQEDAEDDNVNEPSMATLRRSIDTEAANGRTATRIRNS